LPSAELAEREVEVFSSLVIFVRSRGSRRADVAVGEGFDPPSERVVDVTLCADG
jgi:hypothetical protein